MALTPKKSRTSAVRLIASTSSPNCRSAIPPGVTICDVLAGEIAMTPSGMPSTMFTVNGSVAGAPLVYVMFAAISGKLAPLKEGLNVHASTAEQPPDCMRRNSASPLSSSWLPIAEASIFIRFRQFDRRFVVEHRRLQCRRSPVVTDRIQQRVAWLGCEAASRMPRDTPRHRPG